MAISWFAVSSVAMTAQVRGGDSSAESVNVAAALKGIESQVKALRLELIESRMEAQERVIPVLQSEIETLRGQHASLDGEESQARQRLQAFDQQTASNTLTPDEQAQAQSMRAGAGADALENVRRYRAALIARQQQVEARLRVEMQRMNQLQEKTKSLRSAAVN
jgi:hypothetical protein